MREFVAEPGACVDGGISRWRNAGQLQRCWPPRKTSVASWDIRTSGRSKQFSTVRERNELIAGRKLLKMLLPAAQQPSTKSGPPPCTGNRGKCTEPYTRQEI